MLGRKATAALLAKLDLRPSKSLGQNFLVDPGPVHRSLELAALGKGDPVVEIGPGLGTLTGALVAAQARVFAVEVDARLAGHIADTYGDAVDVVCASALDRPTGNAPPGAPVVSNLPYAIATPYVAALLASPAPLPASLTLLLQRECYERFVAQPGSKQVGPISLQLAAAYEPQLPAYPVPPECFSPRPRVQSVLAHWRRRDDARQFAPATVAAMRALFSMRRKQLGGLCRRLAAHHPQLPQWLEAHVGDDKLRPERVSMEQWGLLDGLSSGVGRGR